MKRHDLTGQEFSDWFVLHYSGKSAYGEIMWLCECSCGTRKPVKAQSLRDGTSTNCGCKGKNFKHGMTKTRTFKSWDAMLSRCNNPNDKSFDRYGGRGITVCKRWNDSFEAFFADMGERPEGMSLDRVDNSNGYSKANCRWADAKKQQRNTSVSKSMTFDGRTAALIDWATETGLNYSMLLRRLNAGWPPEMVLSKSRKKRSS